MRNTRPMYASLTLLWIVKRSQSPRAVYIIRLFAAYFERMVASPQSTRCRAIAGSTARCGCKFRYISKFSAVLGGFRCDNNAFELNNSINHGIIRVFNIIYLLPLNSLFNSHCLPPFKMLKLYIVRRYVSLQLQDPRRYRWSAKAD